MSEFARPAAAKYAGRDDERGEPNPGELNPGEPEHGNGDTGEERHG